MELTEEQIRKKARSRAYYERRKEEVKARVRERYYADIERERERKRAYYAAHKEELRAKNAEYRRNNRDKIKARKRAWYIENKDRELEKARRYRLDNAEAIKAQKRNRRKIERLMSEGVSEAEARAIVWADGFDFEAELEEIWADWSKKAKGRWR